ncbi:hypothetical protein SUGI_0948720 [Cryptomeria japonica]|nr:hypothetical protein SUGI_0948720 [Cryptomeria japonica]
MFVDDVIEISVSKKQRIINKDPYSGCIHIRPDSINHGISLSWPQQLLSERSFSLLWTLMSTGFLNFLSICFQKHVNKLFV